MGNSTVAIKDNASFETLMKGSAPALIDFWAEWCAPCRALAPALDELAQKYSGKFVVAKVNVDEYQDLAAQFGIMNIPTMIFFKNGQEVDRAVGLQQKSQLDAKIQNLIG
jgi:thioredoxin 1